MKKALFVFLTFVVSMNYAQEIQSYDLNLNINVKEKRITVDGDIGIEFSGKDSVEFILWKNSSIKEISMSGKPLKYTFDTVSSSPVMYIPNGRRLTIIKSPENINDTSVHFSYECDMKDLNGWANSFSDEWIELNFYCAWFPIGSNGWNSTSKINVSIDSNFAVSGSGKVSRNKGGWEMVQPWGSFDNVIIASSSLKSKILDEGNIYIRTDYSVLSSQDADSVLTECRYIINLFKNYFGGKDSSYLKFILAPFDGGGYSRKNFVCLRTKKFDLHTRTGIAHETAHFWWTGANTSTWEDWLNEAFAEYSMLIYVRERIGIYEFNKKIGEYKDITKNLPPVWGINRNNNDAYSVLYEKGALILFEFENRIGKEPFMHFLKKVVENKITTTVKLLELIEKEFSKETKQWLEDQLKTA